MKIICTYKIINTETGKYYYGSTQNYNKRVNTHLNSLSKGNHHCIYLQRAYNINKNIFKIEIDKIFECIENAREYEQKIINENYGELYNTSKSSSGGDLISYNENRDEIVKKIKDANILRYSKMTPEEKKEKYGKCGASNGMFGKTHTEEVKKKISEQHKNNTYSLGLKRSEETKKKYSIIASERVGEKNGFFGKQHSDETKNKIREARRGKLPSNTKKVVFNNIIYQSVTDCARQNNISPALVIYRIKKNEISYYQEGAETNHIVV